MKKTLLLLLVIGAGAANLQAQGLVAFDNLAPSSGLVYAFPGQPLNQDANFELLGGSAPATVQPIHTWLVSDGSARGINVAPGRFAAPGGGVFAVPGVEPGGTAVLVVLAWFGNYSNWESAFDYGVGGTSGLFQNPTGILGSVPSLVGMVQPVIIMFPEPSPAALAGLALAIFGFRDWCKRSR